MLSRSAQYALRIMAFLAIKGGEEPLRAKDIAAEVSIPPSYLSKILRRMVSAKLLSASKGHGGGFIVAKPASKICFADILEAIDADLGDADCVFGWDACSDKNPCVLHDHWKVIRRSFHAWANQTTLADVKKRIDLLPPVAERHLKDKIRGKR